MKTVYASLIAGGLLPCAALAQNPAPILWVAPPVTDELPGGARFRLDNVAVGDLTGDGRPDLVYVDRRSGAVHLRANQMNGHGWPRQAGAPLATTSADGFVAVGDLTGDGRPDVVTLSLQGDGALRFGVRQPDGALGWGGVDFAAAAPLGSSHGLTLADVNGDGAQDVALNDPGHRVYRVAGAGYEEIVLSGFRALPHPLQFVDFDGDGDLDALSSPDNRPVLFRNDGAFPWIPTGPAGRNLGEGRFAFADIIPGNGAEPIGSTVDHLHLMRKSAPVEWPEWAQTPHLGMYQPVAGDFDGDGDQDLVGASPRDRQTLVFLENDGAGTFRQQQIGPGVAQAGSRGRVWPADLNGDGFQDFVVSYDLSSYMVYTVGRGVLGATWAHDGDQQLSSGVLADLGVVTVQALVPLPEPVAVTELTVLLDGAAAADVFAAVEVTRGGQAVGRLDAAALQAVGAQGVLRIPLAGGGLQVANGSDVALRIRARLSDGAHRVGPDFRVAWDAVGATFADGEDAPVVNQIEWAETWSLPNTAPVAALDQFQAPEGGTVLLDVLANDSDAEQDPLTIEIVQAPRRGQAEVVDGQIRYTHDGQEGGLSDLFQYRARDPRGATSAETIVAVGITPTNDAPQANPDAYVTVEDVPLVVEPDLGPLANDVDPDSEILTVAVAQPPAVGELQLQPDGAFVYLPPADFNGEVTFTYRADDGEAVSEPATVTITVLPDDDAPRPAEGPFATAVDTPVVLALGGVDPEGAATVLLIESFPARGSLVDLRPEAGRVTYVPRRGVVGEDRFTYRLRDDAAASEVYEAVVRVTPP